MELIKLEDRHKVADYTFLKMLLICVMYKHRNMFLTLHKYVQYEFSYVKVMFSNSLADCTLKGQ